RWPRDWSSDVYSSDLEYLEDAQMRQAERGATAERDADRGAQDLAGEPMERGGGGRPPVVTDVRRLSRGGEPAQRLVLADDERLEIGRASCRERGAGRG